MVNKEEIIEYQGKKLRVLEVVDEGKSQEEIEFERWSNTEYCKTAVSQDGYALQYVREQTEDICKTAVSQDGDALPYVREENTFKKILKLKQRGKL